MFRIVLLAIVIVCNIEKNIINAQSIDSIIHQAIEDEVIRNMQELKYKDFAPPFYISITIQDIQTLFVEASFGAIINCKLYKDRSWSNRVLCGNYQINDENFYDATRTKAKSDGMLKLPIENDYWGIRRALWLIINNTYKSASQTYQNKIEALKEKNFPKDSLELPDFSVAPTVKITIPPTIKIASIDSVKNFVRFLSSIFKNISDISYSNVSFYQIQAVIYFYSTENTKIQVPIDYSILNIGVVCDGENSSPVSDALTFLERDFSKIFDKKNIILTAINDLCLRLKEKSFSSYIKENYYGPVLFLHQAAAETWLQGLFGYPDNLFAYREPLYNTSQKTLYYGQNLNTLQSKVNKPIMAKGIYIYDMARVQQWNGYELFGFYPVDAEGVIPADSLLLIEDGFLKTLYNGRTPSRNVLFSNGHMRYNFVNGALISGLGPGNIFINMKNTFKEEELKKMLIQKAKEQGLEYTYIVKPSVSGNFNSGLNLYQINLTTGEEKLVRGGILKSLNINSFRKNVWTSSTPFVYNTFLNENLLNLEGSTYITQQNMPNGTPLTIVCPSAILLDEIEITYYNKPLIDEKPIVPRP